MANEPKFAEESRLKGAVPVVTEAAVHLYALRVKAGDEIHVYTFSWKGERPESVADMGNNPDNLVGEVSLAVHSREGVSTRTLGRDAALTAILNDVRPIANRVASEQGVRPEDVQISHDLVSIEDLGPA